MRVPQVRRVIERLSSVTYTLAIGVRHNEAPQNVLLLREDRCLGRQPSPADPIHSSLRETPVSAATRKNARIEPADFYAAKHPQLGSTTELPVGVTAALKAVATDSETVIDVGCGEGRTLYEVRRQLGINSSLIGFDISHVRCRVAHARGLEVTVADALRLPLSSASVAFAFCRHVIEHVSDDHGLLEEVSRVLRPGALLYLETPLRLPGAWYPHRNSEGEWVLDPTHVREYRNATEVEALLRGAGLTPVRWNVRPIRYPVAHLLHRLFRGVGFSALPPGTLEARSPAVRIPRYREIRVLARAPADRIPAEQTRGGLG
jgi:SAM-dependent methyltransferase